jgi:hypothetical protein
MLIKSMSWLPFTEPAPAPRAARQREPCRDELLVAVASDAGADRHAAIGQAIEERLRHQLRVRIGAEIVAPGSLDGVTGQDRAKTRRSWTGASGERPRRRDGVLRRAGPTLCPSRCLSR